MSGQVWQVASEGGYMYSDELSVYLRTVVQPAMRFRQYCDAKDATEAGTGKTYGAGDKFTWNVYSDAQDGGDQLVENAPIPETNFRITQGSLTITEYGNSVPYTAKLDNLSLHPVQEVINRVLGNDVAKTLDGAAYNQFRVTNLKVNAASGTSTTDVVVVDTGSIGVTNNIAMNKNHVKAISDVMKERNIPAYQGSDYFCVGWPTTFRTFKNDLEALNQYVDQGFRQIMNGEIGRYEGIRFIEQTHVAKGGAEDSTSYNFRTTDPWNNAKSDWAFFFGEDTVAEAIVVPEEMRGKIPGDFGRDKGIAWYYLGGFGIVHAGAGNKNTRIMNWQSNA
jgi:N4-gp56 family major capsid protein